LADAHDLDRTLGGQGDHRAKERYLRRKSGSDHANGQGKLGDDPPIPANRNLAEVTRGDKLSDALEDLIPSDGKLLAQGRGVWSIIHGTSYPFGGRDRPPVDGGKSQNRSPRRRRIRPRAPFSRNDSPESSTADGRGSTVRLSTASLAILDLSSTVGKGNRPFGTCFKCTPLKTSGSNEISA
jgi:hypothetical protein